MIRRPACRLRIDTLKPQFAKIEFIDEDFDYSDRVVRRNIIVQQLRQQRALGWVFALNETLHLNVPSNAVTSRILFRIAFLHSLEPKRTSHRPWGADA